MTDTERRCTNCQWIDPSRDISTKALCCRDHSDIGNAGAFTACNWYEYDPWITEGDLDV